MHPCDAIAISELIARASDEVVLELADQIRRSDPPEELAAILQTASPFVLRQVLSVYAEVSALSSES